MEAVQGLRKARFERETWTYFALLYLHNRRASPGAVGTMVILINSLSVDQLTVAWAPPTTGGVPTSYNLSINDSSSPVVILDTGSSLYTHTFTGLISDTLYTVSVVAINCAATSNVTSLSKLTYPPKSNSISVMYANKTLRHLEITWTPVGGSVTMYKVRVVGNGVSVGQGSATCTTSPCLYVQQVYVPATSYTIFVASRNGDGAVGPENSTTINNPSINDGISNASYMYDLSMMVLCSFLNNQSFYCVRTVDLNGLISGQMYYCKAAATNTTSASCGSPVVGGVKVFFSFMTSPLPKANPNRKPSTSPLPLPSSVGNIHVGAIVGGVLGGGALLLAVVAIVVVVVVKGGNIGTLEGADHIGEFADDVIELLELERTEQFAFWVLSTFGPIPILQFVATIAPQTSAATAPDIQRHHFQLCHLSLSRLMM
eukprot:Em0112g2a